MTKVFICLLSFFCLSQSASFGQIVPATSSGNKKPNTIFILTDDQRWDALGYAGNKLMNTPEMDRLAADGVYFENALVTTPICAASRATILTGLYERAHGFNFSTSNIREEFMYQAYPKILSQNGYYTGFFGKIGILDCWNLSEFGDESIAKIIFGDVVPSGKLPVTIPRSIGQLPFHYSQKEINFKKGYLFLENGPLYPFGYGLSYSKFEYENFSLSASEIDTTDILTVSVKVKNTGKYLAKEVVQLYIKDIIGSVVRPDKELKGFEKIILLPGERKEVVFKITTDMLEFTGLSMTKVLEAGEFEVMIGGSSQEGLSGRFNLRVDNKLTNYSN